MQNKNTLSRLWPVLIGEFHNAEHKLIKNDLLSYFDEYEKKNPVSRKSGENYKLYESKYNLHTEGNEHFKKLINFIANCVLAITKRPEVSLSIL